MAGIGFHSIAKLRAQIHNAVLAYRGVFQADCHREVHTKQNCGKVHFHDYAKFADLWLIYCVVTFGIILYSNGTVQTRV
jgi:hypothetical protein